MLQTRHALGRRSAACCGGRFSSMLDMGGVTAPKADTRINLGKNNRVQAVALDFHLITRSIEERRRMALVEKENVSGKVGSDLRGGAMKSVVASATAPINPDTTLVEKMANLLNVQLGGDSASSKRSVKDDLSAIMGGSKEKSANGEEIGDGNESAPKSALPSTRHIDIRSKYAAKLRRKIDGGFAGLELARSEKEDTMKRGDASLHLAARGLMSSEGIVGSATTSSSRWLAGTGVGKLLSFISRRSMQIALIPLPSTHSNPLREEDVEKTRQDMESLVKQLPHIRFDLLLSDGREKGGAECGNPAEVVLGNVLSKIDVPPLKLVVVSDREDYLKAARDGGMFTCRVRPKNRLRGDITTNYNVEDVASVQDVINDINGISFNSALKG